ncbi:hypothetical protein SDC9_168081 [bioreactor metagenome]|uniref:Uncharacterized protein n=1 Tax=bioreactor metagenome TaxID=1076179 RepID=A0A645G434_9ZZZZ
MAGADGDCQRVHAGAFHKILHLLGIGVAAVSDGNLHVILNAFETAEFAFHNHAVVVRILNNLTGELHVLFVAVVRSVDHDGGETAVDAAFAEFKGVAVVKVDADGQIRLNARRLNELHEVGMVGVFACAGADLEDQRSFQLLGGFGDALNDLHVVDVECTDGVAAGIRIRKHLFAGYDRHKNDLLFLI